MQNRKRTPLASLGQFTSLPYTIIIYKAVMNTISKGNMSTLNCPEEVWLAEKLVDMHPWAEMVRFARSGGEAMGGRG